MKTLTWKTRPTWVLRKGDHLEYDWAQKPSVPCPMQQKNWVDAKIYLCWIHQGYHQLHPSLLLASEIRAQTLPSACANEPRCSSRKLAALLLLHLAAGHGAPLPPL